MPYSHFGQVYPLTSNKFQSSYKRPGDWLPLPKLTESDEKLVGLFPVFPSGRNLVAVSFEGDYTVDWGDGVVEDFTSGSIAEHEYTYENISPSTNCSRGYRQVIISAYPQSEQILSFIDITVRHSSSPQTGTSSPWLDIILSAPNAEAGHSINLSYIVGGGAGSILSGPTVMTAPGLYNLGLLEKLRVITTGGATDLSSLVTICTSLKEVEIRKLGDPVSISYMFKQCFSLRSVSLPDISGTGFEVFMDCPSLETVSLGSIESFGNPSYLLSGTAVKNVFIEKIGSNGEGMFNSCLGLEEVYIGDVSSLQNANGMFSDCLSLKRISFPDTPSLESSSLMFSNCVSLQEVVFSDLSNLQFSDVMFGGCISLKKLVCPPTPLLSSSDLMFSGASSLEEVRFLDLSSLDYIYGMFDGCGSLNKVKVDVLPPTYTLYSTFFNCYSLSSLSLSSSTLFGEWVFKDCHSLTEVEFADCSNADQGWLYPDIFDGTTSLSKLRVPGINVSFSVANCFLSREALIQIFEDLATTEDPLILDITNNWGVINLLPEDYQIATDKGWQVTSNSTSEINVPPSELSLESYSPLIGGYLAEINVPVSTLEIQAKTPSITGPLTLIEVPASTLNFQAVVPTISSYSPITSINVSSIIYTQSSRESSSVDWATNANMTDGSFLNSATGTAGSGPSQWVQMDLGAVYNVARIIIGTATSNIPGGWNRGYTESRNVEYSTDGLAWSVAFNTGTFPSDGIYVYNVSISARYIRIFYSGYVGISEFYALSPSQKYPSTVGTDPIPVGSISYSQSGVYMGGSASNATMTDGSYTNNVTGISGNPPSITMDLGSLYTVDRIIIGTATNNIPGGWSKSDTEGSYLQYSTDNTNWINLYGGLGPFPSDGIYTINTYFEARYIRMYKPGTYMGISEFYALAPGQTYTP